MVRTLVAGIDSSTQQTKLVVVDAATGELEGSTALPHPDGTEIDPAHWLAALEGTGGLRPAGALALSITAQQHSTIFLGGDDKPLRPAILWNDIRAAGAAAELRRERPEAAWLDAVGLLPDAAHPLSRLRWLAEHEPENAARLRTVLLPHDWLTWTAIGRVGAPTTDRSDASATGYWSVSSEAYRRDFIELSLGHDIRTPDVLAPSAVAGTTSGGIIVAAGCGDNAATHLALDTQPGDIVISIGTSTTVSRRSDGPVHDRTGVIDTMADARSGCIPIIAMLNGARFLSATARMLDMSLERMNGLAAGAVPDAGGVTFVPYLDGERNPAAALGSGAIHGLSRQTLTAPLIARAAVLGLACAIADAVDAVAPDSFASPRIFVVGGGARSTALRQAIADLTGRTILHPRHREHAAFGAARQAAWALLGSPPQWPELPAEAVTPRSALSWVNDVRTRYRAHLG